MSEQTTRPSIWGSREREQARWQVRAAGVLAELLERAFREELPPLRWQVQAVGARLVGFAQEPLGESLDRGVRTAGAYERWFAVLAELPASKPIEAFAHRRASDALSLRAVVEVETEPKGPRAYREGRATVGIIVDLDVPGIDKDECPGCDRRGVHVRQVDDGDLVCARCARLVSIAEEEG